MSRFVSAGAINAETGEAVVVAAAEETKNGDGTAAQVAVEPKKNAEWEIVQRELEAERKRREEARVKSVEGGERSLYDVLQANKAAKQAAFEEANKIRNQFRALDDDEIGFLDEVREAKRAEEERVRRETEEGLAAFRRARGQGLKRTGDGNDDDAAEGVGGGGGGGGGEGGGAGGDGGDGAEEEWAVGPRKRRKRERGFGVKKAGEKEEAAAAGRKTPAGEEKAAAAAAAAAVAAPGGGGEKKEDAAKGSPPAMPAKGNLGLVAYGSDSDHD
ncbi:N-terminal domain of NEFA-interacting nuclear protein NIP30-domain-containing protein [Colletotrichum cereale]|nr:N-terminal domain of NEFA-interacting nuclear protein NIP30-domain-containing protein [Colletotrichum cereale]